MDIAQQYAKALFRSNKPDLESLKRSLDARGRASLLPRIFAEYRKLMLKDERSRAHAAITPEGERVRVLLELYRKLVATK